MWTTSLAKTYEFGQKPTHYMEYDDLGSGSTYRSSLYNHILGNKTFFSKFFLI